MSKEEADTIALEIDDYLDDIFETDTIFKNIFAFDVTIQDHTYSTIHVQFIEIFFYPKYKNKRDLVEKYFYEYLRNKYKPEIVNQISFDIVDDHGL